nr:6245_t:CDS:2 [Entrophospora candida]
MSDYNYSTPPLTNKFYQHSDENTLYNTINHHNPNQYSLPQNTQTFPNYPNIVSATSITNTTANVDATFTIASGDNMKPSVSTPLLNDPSSSFSHESNNNIVWLLSRLEKHIYNLLSKLFIRVERLEINVDRNLAELNIKINK